MATLHKERRRCFIDFCLQTGETRVWRTYVGGARLNEWHGRKAEQGFSRRIGRPARRGPSMRAEKIWLKG